jgi:hypothetical protein
MVTAMVDLCSVVVIAVFGSLTNLVCGDGRNNQFSSFLTAFVEGNEQSLSVTVPN